MAALTHASQFTVQMSYQNALKFVVRVVVGVVDPVEYVTASENLRVFECRRQLSFPTGEIDKLSDNGRSSHVYGESQHFPVEGINVVVPANNSVTRAAGERVQGNIERFACGQNLGFSLQCADVDLYVITDHVCLTRKSIISRKELLGIGPRGERFDSFVHLNYAFVAGACAVARAGDSNRGVRVRVVEKCFANNNRKRLVIETAVGHWWTPDRGILNSVAVAQGLSGVGTFPHPGCRRLAPR